MLPLPEEPLSNTPEDVDLGSPSSKPKGLRPEALETLDPLFGVATSAITLGEGPQVQA